MHRWMTGSALAMIAFLSSGCTMSLNEHVDRIGVEQSLPALTAGTPSVVSGQPSLHAIDRRQWTVQPVRVPIRQVEHNPAFGRSIEWGADGDAPSQVYPTAESALQCAAGDAHVAAQAAFEIIALPGSWVAATIDAARSDRSPRDRESFQRLPAADPQDLQHWHVTEDHATNQD